VADAVRFVDDAARRQNWDSRFDMDFGLLFARNRQCDAAQRRFRAAAAKDSAKRNEILKLGERAFDNGDYDEALCLVDLSLGFAPGSASLHSLAGACQFQLKNAPRAVAEIQQAIQIEPENEQYYLQLAEIFIDFNTPDAALLVLNPAAAKFPGSARVRYFAGIASLKLSRYAEAGHFLTESLQLDPKNPLILRALADLDEGQQQWRALLDVSKSMATLPTCKGEASFYEAEARFNLSRDQADSLPEIEALLRSSTIQNPTFAPSFLLWGRVLMARGEHAGSIEKLKRAVNLDPHSRAAIYNLALAYKKSGQTEKSAQAWKRFEALSEKQKNQPAEQRLVYTVEGATRDSRQ
jgi:tetratricopeptide (TPR) repeat protein